MQNQILHIAKTTEGMDKEMQLHREVNFGSHLLGEISAIHVIIGAGNKGSLV
jgi:hypothetical protein